VELNNVALNPKHFDDKNMLGVLARALVDRRNNLKEDDEIQEAKHDQEEWDD